MKHEPPYEKMMAYLDGEMSPTERQAFEELLEQQPEWRDEFNEMLKVTESTKLLHLRPPDPTVWDGEWEEIDNRIQKKFGWLVTLVGAMILIVYGLVKAILFTDNLWAQSGIALVTLGFLVLFLAALRGRLLEIPRDRYRRIRR